ncbi:MAG: FAD-binding protein [Pseudomonadota bacterium]
MTEIIEIDGGEWLDEHRTRDRRARAVYKVKASASGDLAADLAERSVTIAAMMDALAAQSQPVCITGSAWSQSDLFTSPAIRVDTALDRAVWEVPRSALAPGFTGDASRFVFATGGAKLFEIMEFLDARGLSFRTAGSHKGQSIAGAVATGTHGSLLGETGLETHVRGLLFVNGTGAAHWIADPDCPVFSDAFVSGFAQSADPAMFADALIHLGGMGYCAGVLLEAVPRFGLSWAKRVSPLPANWFDLVAQGDFCAAAADATGGRNPAFYELTFDPNAGLDEDVMQTVYWHDDLPDQAAVQPAPDAPGDTLDMIVGQIDACSQAMLDKRCAGETTQPTEEEVEDRPGFLGLDIFGDGGLIRILDIPGWTFDGFRKSAEENPTSTVPASLLALTGEWEPRSLLGIRIDTFNSALCVPAERLREALEIGTELASGFRKHFVYTVRFAQKSPASMSFLRFENNAIINIDGLTRAGIAGWISHSDEASQAFTDALDAAGIPYSMHWGKDIPSNADKIAADFGEAVPRWRAARAAVVPPALQARLTSPMLAHWGLV